MWSHIIHNFDHQSNLHVLEPSCGDGAFLNPPLAQNIKQHVFIDAVEKNGRALTHAMSRVQEDENIKINFVQDDFLKVKLVEGYDLVIGNPPYIGRKLLTEQQISICAKIYADSGLSNKSIRNIWPAFVIKSSQLLSKNGVLAFVLPGELLQVDYASEIRAYLTSRFSAIEILTFKELIFPALGQDVAVVFAYKGSEFSGLRFAQVRGVESLDSSVIFSSRHIAGKTKWSNLVLSDQDRVFLTKVASKFDVVSHYCVSTPGIVTGVNDFFIVNKEIVERYGLQAYCKPILQKSSVVGNVVAFSKAQMKGLQNSSEPSFFIDLGHVPQKKLPKGVQSYLRFGKKKKYHTGYKCSNRKPWYNIPVVWAPVGVIFKRSHLYPKLIRNDSNALFTDSAYRIVPGKEYGIESIIYSFYNSLTLILCELNGRYYGGGVLELTPSEFKGLPLPYKVISKKEFSQFRSKFKNAANIENILAENDNDLLLRLEITLSDIKRLQKIRKKLLSYRLRNSK